MAKKRNRKKKPQQKNHSKIQSHKRHGKKLISTLRQIPNLHPSSWMNERLPDMLWAILLATHLPRENALSLFQQVAKYIDNLPEDEKFWDVTHTGLSKLPSECLDEVLSIITASGEQQEILASLLLLDTLPNRKEWESTLSIDSVDDDWELLMSAVAHTLWHQSQESTDCRWLRIVCRIVAGKSHFPPEIREEILNYPSHADPGKIGGSIRASETALSSPNSNPTEWVGKFWEECLSKTSCFPLNSNFNKMDVLAGTTTEHLTKVRKLLIEHTHNTLTTSEIDAQHDTVLGIGLYCLGLLQELLPVGRCNSISARTSLRTIAECYITLAYLAEKNNAELWQSYRVYGAGQAKLAFLKLDESADEPSYVDVQTLEQLANEDMWQEFLNIDLGHWDNTNLRTMSVEAGVKDVYDQFYDWTSTFAHGHWGAIRNTIFDTCGNPLHRLHRIPRQSSRALPDVIPDACKLIDKILEVVSQLYPDFPHRVTLKI